MTLTSTDEIATKLAEIVGATHLSSAPADVGAFGGLDPLAVVWPGSPQEVAGVLKACTDMRVAVGVAGHSTRVTRHWPVRDDRPRVALDTRRLSSILEIDEVSLVVHTQAGILVRHLEEALRRQELTLGPYPSEIYGSTLGGLLAAPPPVAHSPRTGRLADACLGLAVAHAGGAMIQTRIAPRRATGPDIARLYVGSRGGLGVITSAVLRVHRLPEQVLPLAFAFDSLGAACAAAAEALALGARPGCLQVLGAALVGDELGESAEAVLLAVLWGPASQVAREHNFIDQVLSEARGKELTQSTASRWWERRSSLSASREPPPGRVAARVAHARLPEALEAVAGLLHNRAQHVWAERFTLQSTDLWFSARNGENGKPALAAALLDAGLDPLRLNFPPLMEQLRARLDPQETLVVMES